MRNRSPRRMSRRSSDIRRPRRSSDSWRTQSSSMQSMRLHGWWQRLALAQRAIPCNPILRMRTVLALVLVASVAGCDDTSAAAAHRRRAVSPGGSGADFSSPESVTIRGYDSDAMEPFITRDGRYLLFNDSNAPGRDTNLHYAERIDDVTFEYRGQIDGINSGALDGVATVDASNTIYFVSTRSYSQTLSTIYRGT